ncbi:MAG: hypothetical protein HQK66_00600, partial [Desulfamplus sp.]|nr:hypothetical protein [Desulfamplus sp.]
MTDTPTKDNAPLESILEDICLEFVLGELSDPKSFSAMMPLLKKFFQTARSLNLPDLAADARKAG